MFIYCQIFIYCQADYVPVIKLSVHLLSTGIFTCSAEWFSLVTVTFHLSSCIIVEVVFIECMPIGWAIHNEILRPLTTHPELSLSLQGEKPTTFCGDHSNVFNIGSCHQVLRQLL